MKSNSLKTLLAKGAVIVMASLPVFAAVEAPAQPLHPTPSDLRAHHAEAPAAIQTLRLSIAPRVPVPAFAADQSEPHWSPAHSAAHPAQQGPIAMRLKLRF